MTETGAKLVFNFAGHDISNVGDLVSEDGGFVDGINQASIESANSEVYNLQGIRVKKANKGVYIQNGKKVVIK